ncbi:MAG: hypothetical protein H7837_13780, partial [Magnetococcus sp. MYC-9]
TTDGREEEAPVSDVSDARDAHAVDTHAAGTPAAERHSVEDHGAPDIQTAEDQPMDAHVSVPDAGQASAPETDPGTPALEPGGEADTWVAHGAEVDEQMMFEMDGGLHGVGNHPAGSWDTFVDGGEGDQGGVTLSQGEWLSQTDAPDASQAGGGQQEDGHYFQEPPPPPPPETSHHEQSEHISIHG